MKIDRLMGIILHLLKNGRVSAAQLANKFEVNTRTIMRDMEALCQAGVPIISTFGVNGGYEISDTYVLDKQLASEHDYNNIIAALRTMASAYESKAIQNTIDKITLLAAEKAVTVDIDLGAAHENRDTNNTIKALENAIEHKRCVQFTYTNNADETHLVLAEPVGIIYKWYNWYLIGYSTKHSDYRMYKLVRMEDLAVTIQSVSKEHSLEKVMDKWESSPKNTKIRVVGQACIKAKCKEYLNMEIIQEFENGDFEFNIYAPETELFWFGVLLSFGNKAKVLEPLSVIEKIKSVCTGILDIYGEGRE